jgi:hypothetical protein
MELVDPGPLLPPQQLAGMMRQAVLPGHEALLNFKAEGNILAGGIPVGEGYSVYCGGRFPRRARLGFAGNTFLGIDKTKVTPLQDFEDRRDQDRQFTEQLEQTLQQ